MSPVVLWLIGAIVTSIMVGNLLVGLPNDREPDLPANPVESIQSP